MEGGPAILRGPAGYAGSMRPLSVIIIGGGFGGLSAAAFLARGGANVTLLEKNPSLGGRARVWTQDGFRFDMGPSWYWMPDVFQRLFEEFDTSASDHYSLHRLDPSYRVWFGPGDAVDLPAGPEAVQTLFESLEVGAGSRLQSFLKDAEYKYRRGMGDVVHKPGLSVSEFADPRLLWALVRLQMLQSFRSHVGRHFTDPRLRQIVEFPVLFLGSTAPKTPALFSLMNHADMVLGTWYPQGGMGSVVGGMTELARREGAELRTNAPVTRILVSHGRVTGVEVDEEGKPSTLPADVVLANADYAHVEERLLAPQERQYNPRYWETRTLSPSALLFYLGVEGRVEGLQHHTLFFDEDLDAHADAIYENPRWPERPLFYVSAPSRTDPSVAPPGHENLCILIPLAPDLKDTDDIRERYFQVVMDRLETITGQSIRDRIVLKRSYAHRDFSADYNALGGNAYGLANTLRQTALLRPRLRSRKVRGLYFAGQMTVPGPGVPPAIISGEVAARQILRDQRFGR